MALLTCRRLLMSSVRNIETHRHYTCPTRSTKQKSVANLVSKELIYSQFGDPVDVVKFRETCVPELGEQDVLVRMLAAPVNPADINTIQGKYPVKVELPCVPGNEGVGIVEEMGKGVQDIAKGNKVIVTKPVQGTWRNIATFKKDVLRVVPDNLGIVEAATLTVNPCTAYRMLTDFVPVKDGHVLIQNGANGACGQNVIQICKAWGVKTVNIVRNRPDIADLKKYLKDLGATYVLTEEELRTTTIFKDKKIDKPALALNCVGGKSSSEMLRHLEHSGKMVTYGGMSRQPVSIPTSAFIFKNISFHGFWMTAWNEKSSKQDKDKMMSEVIALMCENKLKGPIHKMVDFDKYQEALKNALTVEGFTGNNALLPVLPCVGGCEGVGEIVEIGHRVSSLKLGQRVIVCAPELGTWRSYGIYNEFSLQNISQRVPLPEAAMLSSGPCTAYRMLKDIFVLKAGETVIQDAAMSACGQSVIQLCKIWGIKTINIVPDGDSSKTCVIKDYLKSIGATKVYTISEIKSLKSFRTSLVRPILGLHSLGYPYEKEIHRLVNPVWGAIVYHGSAFNMPVCCSSKKKLNRFHIGNWFSNAKTCDIQKMLYELVGYIMLGKFKAPAYESTELRNFTDVFLNLQRCESSKYKSYIFDLTLA